jgi:hypothetical protein
MIKYLRSLLLLLFLLLVPAVFCLSADVTPSWDPSPSPDVQGYYVYYKQNDPTLPFDGTGANEGSSPIDVNDDLTTTITGLSDSSIYYFTITAYDSDRNESTFSNIVSNNAIVPKLLSPAEKSSNEPVPVTFQWSTTAGMTYTLYYGTDPNLNAVVLPPANQSSGTLPNLPHAAAIFFSLILSLLLFTQLIRSNRGGYAAAALAACLVLAACGGGGGGGDSGTTSTKTTTSNDDGGSAYSVDVGTSDYYQAFDLDPGTTYYWKVVGTDSSDPSKKYLSPTHQFTTEKL